MSRGHMAPDAGGPARTGAVAGVRRAGVEPVAKRPGHRRAPGQDQDHDHRSTGWSPDGADVAVASSAADPGAVAVAPVRQSSTGTVQPRREPSRRRDDRTHADDGRGWPGRAAGVLSTYLQSFFAIASPSRLARLDVPWLTFAAIAAIDEVLRARRGEAVAFEYGSGASTAWLARRCARVWSAEHDPRYAEVTRRLTASFPGAELLLAPPRSLAAGEMAAAASQRRGFRDLDFADYVAAIDRPGEPFDLILIDGRARVACLKAALGRIKADGLIVLDNSDRREYAPALEALVVPPRRYRGLTPCLPYPGETALIRPGSGGAISLDLAERQEPVRLFG